MSPGCRFPWTSAPALEMLCREATCKTVFAADCTQCIAEVIHAADNQGPSCCFAIQALANIHEESAAFLPATASIESCFFEARGEVQAALDQYERLKELDRIRAKYWCWRALALLGRHEHRNAILSSCTVTSHFM